VREPVAMRVALLRRRTAQRADDVGERGRIDVRRSANAAASTSAASIPAGAATADGAAGSLAAITRVSS
jgi:hypothetical protein